MLRSCPRPVLATVLAICALPWGAWAQTTEAVCAAAPELSETTPVRGTTVNAPDRFHASCARNALSGERVYRLQVPQRARVSLRVEADYDAAIYVRRDCADAVTEVACNDDARDTRHAALDLDLDAGTWFVFVDGYDLDAEGSFTLRVAMQSLAPRVEVRGALVLGGRTDLRGTRVEALDRAGQVVATGIVDDAGRFVVRVPGSQLVRVRAVVDRVELSSEFFDAAQRPAITLGGASVRRAPAGTPPPSAQGSRIAAPRG